MHLPKIQLAAPALCLMMLGAVYAERARRLTPVDVEPYHAKTKAAVEAVRYTLGTWTGVDVPVPAAAQQLLRPNALLSRAYVDHTPGQRTPTHASLLIVQCRDPRDMQGHYPPNCYPAHGSVKSGEEPMTFTVPASGGRPELTVHATEYRFTSGVGGAYTTTVVLNTMIVPGVGTTADMGGVYRAAEDYQRRLYGAAQLQVVVADNLPAERRRAVYQQFLEACGDTIHAGLDAGTRPAGEARAGT